MINKLTDTEFFRLTAFVRDMYGINLEKKRTLIEARLAYDIEKSGYRSYGEYIAEVIRNQDGQECKRMINRLSTNYTYFFREPETIKYFVKNVLPLYLRDSRGVSVWCAACASGEEAYSLSMAAYKSAFCEGAGRKYSILATDINTDMLETAEKGEYPLSALDSIPQEYRGCVHQKSGRIQINAEIASPISWKRENLLSIYGERRFDVIFCRNVMIYFTPEDREKLARKLHDSLNPGGWLFVSCVESIDMGRKLFIHEKPAIYRKREII